MVEDIIKYGELNPEEHRQTQTLREHLVDTAEEYGFTVDIREMDYPGMTATTGDHLEVDPRFIDDNALTYLSPTLMEAKIDTRIQELRGTYEDPHYGPEEMKTRERRINEIDQELTQLHERQRKNFHEMEENGTLTPEEVKTRNSELQEEVDELQQEMNWYNQPQTSQALLYMVNEQIKEGHKPAKALAVHGYNPAHYNDNRDKLEGFFEEHFTAAPWLDPETQKEVVDNVEQINHLLEQKAKQLE